ncbi:MAG: DNA-directed RNA polymerase subunit D [Candidatus Micrarchaeaceae archaeon]
MKIELIGENEKYIRILIKGAALREVNALRRSIMNSVKTFAIDKVTFYENSSPMFDEFIAHRIGLVPIKTPEKGYQEDSEIMFSLDASGPKTVYSDELKSADKEIQVANSAIPIIKLNEEQRLRIEGKAVLGDGRRHAKFQPGFVNFVERGDSDFEFYVETFGQMPPRTILTKGIEAITGELKTLGKEVKKL